MSPVKISIAQARWFKFRRSGLLQPFDNAADAARQLIGIQAQLPVAADLSLYNRIAGVSQASLEQERIESKSIVRMWGQRNTVHLYATEDWPLLELWFRDRNSVLTAKFEEAGLAGVFNKLVRHFEQRLLSGEQLIYKDASAFKGFSKLNAVREEWQTTTQGLTTQGGSNWLVAYAAFMRLVRDGIACHGPDQNGESTFVHRQKWVPDLVWDQPAKDQSDAEAACRYLAAYGPATPHDLAAYFGTTITAAKTWIARADDRIVPVLVDEKKAVLLEADIDNVLEKPPAPAKWPLRLLYRFDPFVLGAVGSKNKEWLLDKDNFKKVWRPGAHIEAVILVGGRIMGTWRYNRRSKGLILEIKPFKPFNQRQNREIAKQGAGIVNFLGQELIAIK